MHIYNKKTFQLKKKKTYVRLYHETDRKQISIFQVISAKTTNHFSSSIISRSRSRCVWLFSDSEMEITGKSKQDINLLSHKTFYHLIL